LVYRLRGQRAGGEPTASQQALRTVGATLGAIMLVPAEEGERPPPKSSRRTSVLALLLVRG
jgi:hypothetical protein